MKATDQFRNGLKACVEAYSVEACVEACVEAVA